jgi:hypothetical protein
MRGTLSAGELAVFGLHRVRPRVADEVLIIELDVAYQHGNTRLRRNPLPDLQSRRLGRARQISADGDDDDHDGQPALAPPEPTPLSTTAAPPKARVGPDPISLCEGPNNG